MLIADTQPFEVPVTFVIGTALCLLALVSTPVGFQASVAE